MKLRTGILAHSSLCVRSGPLLQAGQRCAPSAWSQRAWASRQGGGPARGGCTGPACAARRPTSSSASRATTRAARSTARGCRRTRSRTSATRCSSSSGAGAASGRRRSSRTSSGGSSRRSAPRRRPPPSRGSGGGRSAASRFPRPTTRGSPAGGTQWVAGALRVGPRVPRRRALRLRRRPLPRAPRGARGHRRSVAHVISVPGHS